MRSIDFVDGDRVALRVPSSSDGTHLPFEIQSVAGLHRRSLGPLGGLTCRLDRAICVRYSNLTLCSRTVAPKASYCVRKNSANFAGLMP